jgi:opacity protein-like surface antigen
MHDDATERARDLIFGRGPLPEPNYGVLMRPYRSLSKQVLLGSLMCASLLLCMHGAAHAVQLVPSIGISQSQDGGDNEVMYGVALRNGLLPRTQAEIQVGYRKETYAYAGQSFDLNTTPVTLSLWVSPVPMLYAGGGVGAYIQSVKYQDNVYPASHDSNFGAHLGGGMRFSLTPMVGFDLQGRYVFMKDQASQLASGDFNPSFWTLQAGLAIGF